MNSVPWYRAGLRFQCQRCGRCCSGKPGDVLMSESEARAMADALHLEFADFCQRYLADGAGRFFKLREVKSPFGSDCIMLERDSRQPRLCRCKVHQVRPTQCRTWPFWEENLESQLSWKKAKRRCPGLDKGELVELKQIEAQSRQDAQASAEIWQNATED